MKVNYICLYNSVETSSIFIQGVLHGDRSLLAAGGDSESANHKNVKPPYWASLKKCRMQFVCRIMTQARVGVMRGAILSSSPLKLKTVFADKMMA